VAKAATGVVLSIAMILKLCLRELPQPGGQQPVRQASLTVGFRCAAARFGPVSGRAACLIPGLTRLEIGVNAAGGVDYACDVVLYSEFESGLERNRLAQ
jgi:hypothetical protein